MTKFVVEEDFWGLFPNARIGVVVCHNINNFIIDEDKYKEMILISEKQALKYLNLNYSWSYKNQIYITKIYLKSSSYQTHQIIS